MGKSKNCCCGRKEKPKSCKCQPSCRRINFIDQRNLPIEITDAGYYALRENLLFETVGAAQNAITVAANNVTIDLCDHVLSISPNNVGIFADIIFNLTIQNGTIASTEPATLAGNNAITLLNAVHVIVDNMIIRNVNIGVSAGIFAVAPGPNTPGVIDLQISNTTFEQPSPRAVRAIALANSQGVRIEKCTFVQIGGINTGAATGLFSDVSDIVINDCQLLNANGLSNATGFSIQIVNRDGSNYAIDNCQFNNNALGVIVATFAQTITGICGRNISIRNSKFTNNTNSAVNVQSINGQISNAIIENCSVNKSLQGFRGISFGEITKDVIIRNCDLTNMGFGGINGRAIEFLGEGLLVENCNMHADPTNDLTLAYIGNNILGTAFLPGRNIIFKNCTFSNPQAVPRFSALTIYYADGVLIDNCIVDSNSPGFPIIPNPAVGGQFGSANIRLGGFVLNSNFIIQPGQGTNVNNVRITNSEIYNNAQFGIFSFTGNPNTPNQNIVVDNCSISGAREAGVFLFATNSSLVKNCHIVNGIGSTRSPGHGIVLGELPAPFPAGATSRFNSILDNNITQNTGTGILIQTGSTNNFVKDNNVYGNTNGIINQAGVTNQFYNNISCGNTNINCTGVTPSGEPGNVPVSLGENICCGQAAAELKLAEHIINELLIPEYINNHDYSPQEEQLILM